MLFSMAQFCAHVSNVTLKNQHCPKLHRAKLRSEPNKKAPIAVDALSHFSLKTTRKITAKKEFK
jgi:hypothetical protein